MLRFVFAGLVTVGGMVALLLASTGGIPGVPSHPDERVAAVGLQASPAAAPHADTQGTPDISQGQIALLRAQLRDARQDLNKLRGQAAKQRRQLAELQREHGADRAKLTQLKSAEAEQQKAADAARQQVAAAQAVSAQAGRDAATELAAAEQERQQLAKERAATQQARQEAAQAQATAAKVRPTGAVDQAREAAADVRSSAPSQSDVAEPAQTAMRAPPWSIADTGAPHRLTLARTAIANGQLERARQLLEQAQLQLVFRPVSPGEGSPPGESRAAADVGDALSMLGTGQDNFAVRYVDRALADAGTSTR